jgi:hypothetical protein
MNRTELTKALKDPRFRIEQAKLYWIVSKKKDNRGRDVSEFEPFVPFPHQKKLNERIYGNGSRRILVPKARRMGFSTDINVCQLDGCLNNTDFHSRIVDMSEDDAKDKLVNRVQRSFRRLNEVLDTGLEVISESGKEISWSNGSRFTASISGRGGDAAHFLHVSELGPIDYKDPKRANEIIDGAFPAADGGIIVVESTAKGPAGHFKRLCDNAQEIKPADRTVDDWEVLFFPWFEDPRHTRTNGKISRVSPEVNKYLDDAEKRLGFTFTVGQRVWYQMTSETVHEMRYEYPTFLEECWEAPIEGAIYADDINRARAAGRVGSFPYIPRVPVFTIWDLGGPRNTRCIFFQLLHGTIRIIDAIAGGFDPETRIDGPRLPQDWADELQRRQFSYGANILPHDGETDQYGGLPFQKELALAGVLNTKCMQRRESNNDWARINPTWANFDRFEFNVDSPGVEILIKHLSCYHTRSESDGITVKERPHHDWSSHYAEAFSSIIEAEERGYCSRHMGSGNTGRRKRPAGMAKYNPYG